MHRHRIPWQSCAIVFTDTFVCRVGVQVALLVPWLSIGEQKLLYPDGLTFAQPEDQVRHISPLHTHLNFQTPHFIERGNVGT
jgi:hypothetical protein